MAKLKIAKGNPANPYALEICHVAAQSGEHALDLMVHAFGDGNFTLALTYAFELCAPADSAVLEDKPLLCCFNCVF